MNTLFNILKDIQTYPSPSDFAIKDLSPFGTRYVSANDDKDAYEIEFSFAGYSKNQIKIKATDELLTIEAKNKKDSQKEVVSLGNHISLDHIVADYTHGLLKLTLPKKGVNEGREIKIA
jgi:HSP20 family molecular chaperone IbpA